MFFQGVNDAFHPDSVRPQQVHQGGQAHGDQPIGTAHVGVRLKIQALLGGVNI